MPGRARLVWNVRAWDCLDVCVAPVKKGVARMPRSSHSTPVPEESAFEPDRRPR